MTTATEDQITTEEFTRDHAAVVAMTTTTMTIAKKYAIDHEAKREVVTTVRKTIDERTTEEQTTDAQTTETQIKMELKRKMATEKTTDTAEEGEIKTDIETMTEIDTGRIIMTDS